MEQGKLIIGILEVIDKYGKSQTDKRTQSLTIRQKNEQTETQIVRRIERKNAIEQNNNNLI